jgi:hypothetical protein
MNLKFPKHHCNECVCRPYWRCYFPNTQAIIYVVDSSDTDRLVTAKEEFHAILEVMPPTVHKGFPFTYPGLMWWSGDSINYCYFL